MPKTKRTKVKDKPIASYAIMGGFTGKRVGTGYCYSEEEARAYSHFPYFRRRKLPKKKERKG